MATKIFVNLPVKDLARSVAFFKTLGYAFNPQFTDENATCMIVGEDIYVMLLVEKFFQTFTPRPVADAVGGCHRRQATPGRGRRQGRPRQAAGLQYSPPLDIEPMDGFLGSTVLRPPTWTRSTAAWLTPSKSGTSAPIFQPPSTVWP